MSKKILALALSVVGVAMFALPAVASATPLHVSSTGKFTVEGKKEGSLSTTGGTTVKCGEVSGNGEFTTTTGGTLSLKFGPTCTTTVLGSTRHCQSTSPAAGTGLIETTVLRFDLVTLNEATTKNPGILVTPNAATGVFAHIECETIVGPINFTVEGNGVLGTITAPACEGTSATATLNFVATAHGVQQHTLSTGVTYQLKKGTENAAQNTEATMKFNDGVGRKLTCT
jgi:hypothetical protein